MNMQANYKITLIIVLIISFFVKTSSLLAQIKGHDVVYLKNGSIIKGAIVSTDEDSTVKIMIKGGSVFAYPYTQVQKMSFNVGADFERPKDGVKFQLAFGGLVGSNGGFFYYLAPLLPEFDVNVGYQKKQHYLCISSGFELFDGLSIPLLLNYQYSFTDKAIAPFFEVYGGTGFNTDTYYDVSPAISAGGSVGLKRNFGNGLSFFLSSGYRFHQYKYTFSDWFFAGTTTNTLQANRIQIKMGIGF